MVKRIIYANLFCLLFLVSAIQAAAHKPTFNDAGSPKIAEAFGIDEIDISLALYGALPSATAVDYYRITVPEGHTLDFQLFVPIACQDQFRPQIALVGPDVAAAGLPDFVEVPKGFAGRMISLEEWGSYFEPFTRSSYWSGPEVRQQATAGDYYVAVFAESGETGTYLLSMAGREDFEFEPDWQSRKAEYDRCEFPPRAEPPAVSVPVKPTGSAPGQTATTAVPSTSETLTGINPKTQSTPATASDADTAVAPSTKPLHALQTAASAFPSIPWLVLAVGLIIWVGLGAFIRKR